MKKLIEFKKLGLIIEKDSENPHYKSKYASLDNIISLIQPALSELWLMISHSYLLIEWIQYLETTILDVESKEEIKTKLPILGAVDMQKLWSALTYARRYNISCLLDLSTEDDDDWNKTLPNKELKPEIKKEDDDKPRFGDKNFDKLKESYLEGKIEWKTYKEAIKEIFKIYNVNKSRQEKLQILFK